jgi:hypothetical protein
LPSNSELNKEILELLTESEESMLLKAKVFHRQERYIDALNVLLAL